MAKTMSNVTPITAAKKLDKVMAERLEELRVRIFRAMNFVWTTEFSLQSAWGDDALDQRGALEAAYEILGEVASELNAISGQ
jgi:hypothetical protein